MARHDETAADWTETVATRVSPRAKKLLEEKLASLQGVSQAAYVRRLLYKELGLIKEG